MTADAPTRSTGSASAGNPIGFGRMLRKEDARFLRGQGNYVDDIAAAGHAPRRDPAQPARARPHRVDRHVGGRGPPQGQGGDHRRHPRGPGPGVDADAVARRPGRARHRQGALPGPGGRVRRRRRPLRGPRRPRADRGRLRAARPGDRRAAGRSTPARPSSATTSRARPTTTSSTGSPATRRECDEVFAGADVVVAQDMLYPRVHPAPMETCGSIAHMDKVTGKLTAWITTQAPARPPHRVRPGGRPARAQDPGDLARHRRRLRQQGRRSTRATCWPWWAPSSPASR